MTPAARHSGFTLLESLVVVAIIAIASTLLVAGISRSEASVAQEEARRLAALMDLALAEARATGQTLAWSADGDGYVFWRRSEDGAWSRYPDSSPYRRRTLPAGTEIAPFRGDQPQYGHALAPGERILLQPFGVPAPFAVALRSGGARLIVKGSAVGRVTVERIHAG